MTGFGWNFYGFFLFAGAWIAAYFAWAWWMERRETTAERTRNDHGRARAARGEGAPQANAPGGVQGSPPR